MMVPAAPLYRNVGLIVVRQKLNNYSCIFIYMNLLYDVTRRGHKNAQSKKEVATLKGFSPALNGFSSH